jgi:hypothetical protein
VPELAPADRHASGFVLLENGSCRRPPRRYSRSVAPLRAGKVFVRHHPFSAPVPGKGRSDRLGVLMKIQFEAWSCRRSSSHGGSGCTGEDFSCRFNKPRLLPFPVPSEPLREKSLWSWSHEPALPEQTPPFSGG